MPRPPPLSPHPGLLLFQSAWLKGTEWYFNLRLHRVSCNSAAESDFPSPPPVTLVMIGPGRSGVTFTRWDLHDINQPCFATAAVARPHEPDTIVGRLDLKSNYPYRWTHTQSQTHTHTCTPICTQVHACTHIFIYIILMRHTRRHIVLLAQYHFCTTYYL